jgi:amino acid transporter
MVFSHIHKDFGTPHNAIFLLCLESIIFVLLGDIASLITLNGMIAVPFYLLSAVSLVVLRFKEAHTSRPFKVWIAIPIIFSFVSFSVILLGAYSSPLQTLISLFVFVIGTAIWWMDESRFNTLHSIFMGLLQSIKSKIIRSRGYDPADSMDMNELTE